MEPLETNSHVGARSNDLWKKLDSLIDNSWGLPQPPIRKAKGEAAPAARSLQSLTDSLVFAYLAAGMGTRGIPLKEFMDGFEKAILLASLHLTLGNQKDASAILGIKPTAMFEKMHKHCINGRRMKLSEKLLAGERLAR